MDKEEITFLRKVIKAQEQLLMCYRMGGHPQKWCLDVLSKFKELYKKGEKNNASTKDKGEKQFNIDN